MDEGGGVLEPKASEQEARREGTATIEDDREGSLWTKKSLVAVRASF